MITPLQQKAIYLYIQGNDWKQVAEELNISAKTIYNTWKKDKEFLLFYHETLDELNQDVLTRLPKIELTALEELERQIQDECLSAKERRAAANAVLVHGRRCREYLSERQLISKLDEARRLREELSNQLQVTYN